jgi:glutathione S-transferase
LEKNNGFLVGKKFSYADFAIATAIEFVDTKMGVGVVDKYPALRAHSLKVFSAPGIKEWVVKRPATEN